VIDMAGGADDRVGHLRRHRSEILAPPAGRTRAYFI